MRNPPVFQVDFNELVDLDLVLLSKGDQRHDINGHLVTLVEGMAVVVFDEDLDEHGERDDLIAYGAVVPNPPGGWAQHVKWACRIDRRGIRHRSDDVASD